MKYLVPSLVYPSFFALIGFSIYYTGSAMPLWALLLTPSWSAKKGDEQ